MNSEHWNNFADDNLMKYLFKQLAKYICCVCSVRLRVYV